MKDKFENDNLPPDYIWYVYLPLSLIEAQCSTVMSLYTGWKKSVFENINSLKD